MRMYSAKFADEDCEVRGAREGREVIAEARDFKPSLILLDMVLPDEGGLAVLKRLKEEPALARIPVILIADVSSPSDRERGRTLGAVEYIVKMHLEPSEFVEKALSFAE